MRCGGIGMETLWLEIHLQYYCTVNDNKRTIKLLCIKNGPTTCPTTPSTSVR